MAMLVITLIATLLVFQTIMVEAQQRPIMGSRPHGLPYETPIAFSPSAYEFFHPGVVPPRARSAAAAPGPAPARAAALRGALDAGRARADEAVGGGAWLAPPRGRGGGGDAGLGARGVAGVAVGAAAAALVGAGASYVVARRRANIRRAKGDAQAYVA